MAFDYQGATSALAANCRITVNNKASLGRSGMTNKARLIDNAAGIGLLAVLMLTTFSGSAAAQHLISTKAGFVNRTDGRVYVTRHDNLAADQENERGRASMGTQMRQGDLLSTEAGAFAEVLLNPGTYLRLNEKSTIRAIDTSLTSVEFELVSGSAILEAGEIDKRTPLRIKTVNATFFVKKEGLIRFDLLADATRVAVRQGEVRMGTLEQVIENEGLKIGRGKMALFKGTTTPDLAKIDQDAFDTFDVWSFNRARALVSANNSALGQSRSQNSLAYGWFFDPFSGSYTFIPRNGLFYSPYGFGFFNSFGNCFTCMNSFFYRNQNSLYGYGSRGPNGGTGGQPAITPSTPGRVITGADRTPIQRDIEGRRISANPGMTDGGFGPSRGMGMDGGMGRSVGMPAPVILAAPAPARGMDMGGGAAPSGGAPARPSRN